VGRRGASNRARLTWGLRATLVAVAVFALLTTPAGANKKPPAKPNKKAKPDLIVTAAALTSSHYLFRNEQHTVTFTDRTKNRGAGKAAHSQTGLYLVHESDRFYLMSHHRVPALKHGESWGDKTTMAFKAPRDLGLYTAKVCANVGGVVAETTLKNNCRSVGEVSVIARRWTGHVIGITKTTNPSGVEEDLTATNVTMIFDHDASDQASAPAGTVVEYAVASATVTYTLSGTDSSGCTWSGGSTYQVADHRPSDLDGFWIDVTLASYYGEWLLDDNAPRYDITVACPHGGTQVLKGAGPWRPAWFFAGLSANRNAITPEFGYTSLNGALDASPSTGNPTSYEWHFKAQ
jgi:hypothetical protein